MEFILLLASRYFDLIEPNHFFFFSDIDRTAIEIICKRGTSGRKSNDLRNWIKPKRKLRNRASSAYGKEERERERAYWDISAGAHTPGANEKHHREFSASLAHHPLCPSPPSSSGRPPSGYPSGWNPGPGFRFAFGACPLTERVSHSIRNNALSAEALFRNDSCCVDACFDRARTIITSPLTKIPVYLASFLQFLSGKIVFLHASVCPSRIAQRKLSSSFSSLSLSFVLYITIIFFVFRGKFVYKVRWRFMLQQVDPIIYSI